MRLQDLRNAPMSGSVGGAVVATQFATVVASPLTSIVTQVARASYSAQRGTTVANTIQ